MNKKVLYLVHGAVIAALYVVLTMLANALGLANYAIQVRFSEALTILPVFTPAAIPGLFLGCIISNTMTGCMLLDIIFGNIIYDAGEAYNFGQMNTVLAALVQNRSADITSAFEAVKTQINQEIQQIIDLYDK